MKFNLNSTLDFVIGNILYEMYNSPLKRFIHPHIVEQIENRFNSCPDCVSRQELKCCGCKSPNAFFKVSGCKHGKWPKLMNKQDWNFHKKFLQDVKESKIRCLLDSLTIEELSKIGIVPNQQKGTELLRPFDIPKNWPAYYFDINDLLLTKKNMEILPLDKRIVDNLPIPNL